MGMHKEIRSIMKAIEEKDNIVDDVWMAQKEMEFKQAIEDSTR